MSRKIKRWTAALFLAAVILALPAMSAEAAKLKGTGYFKSGKTIKADLTHDGKDDTVKICASLAEGDYVGKVTVYVNGRRGLSVNIGDFHIYQVGVKYLCQSNSKEFLNLYGVTDNDYIVFNKIYRYDAKTKKLACVADLNSVPCHDAEVVSVTSGKITVKYSSQFAETGYITWNYNYQYKNGKLKLVSNTAAAKSKLGSFYYNEDGYKSLFKKNRYKVSKPTLKLYTNTKRTKAAFTAKEGDVLTLKQISYSGGKYYLQFQKGNKKGWLRIGNSHSDVYRYGNEGNNGWFYGVEHRLAG